MKHALAYRFAARILLISLCLQNCSHSINPSIDTREEPLAHKKRIIPQTCIQPILDQALTAQGGHQVTFYEKEGKLKADVAMNVPQGFSKRYEGLEVIIEQGAILPVLPQLSQKSQAGRIHIQTAHAGKPARVIIYKGAGLMGGGNIIVRHRGNPEEEDLEEERELEQEDGIDERKMELITQLEVEDQPNDALIKKRKRTVEELELPLTQRNKKRIRLAADEQESLKDKNQAKDADKELTQIGVAIPSLRKLAFSKAVEVLECISTVRELNETFSQTKGGNGEIDFPMDLSNELREAIIVRQEKINYEQALKVTETDKEYREKETEDMLFDKICNYKYHPSDYVHGLLASHVYTNPRQGDPIDLQAFSLQWSKTLPTNRLHIWKIAQVEDGTDDTGYYSALYVDEATNQAVLSFQGTKPGTVSSFFERVKGTKAEPVINVLNSKDLKEDLVGVLTNHITAQQILAYKATEAAVRYAKEKGLHLSITGHSLGGYLAELGVAFCYLDFDYREVKAVVFDSPGIGKKLDTFKPNVKNPSTKLDTRSLPILAYLSAPNIVNACNWHPGEVYRVYPDLKWSDWTAKWVERASSIPMVGEDIVSSAKGLLALTGHSLDTILSLFDASSGKPIRCVRIADWPKINPERAVFVGHQGKLGATLGGMLGQQTGLPIGGFVGRRLGAFLEDNLDKQLCLLSSLVSLIIDYKKIDGSQYWNTLEQLDEGYSKPATLSPAEAFKLKYKGHYRESTLQSQEHILHVEKFRSVDWYLYELYKQRSILERLNAQDITVKVLKDILKDYTIINIADRPYIKLNATQAYVEQLRDKIRRALDVLTREKIETVMDVHYLLQERFTKHLEAIAIKEIHKLPSYIAQAKVQHYVVREDKQKELINHLQQNGICVIYGHGGVGKSTLAAEYGYEQKGIKVARWLQAETKEKLIRSYQELAKELGISYQALMEELKQEPERYLEELSRSVYNELAKRGQGILLILDNANDANLIAECLLHKPESIEAIITTRSEGSFSHYKGIKLASFKPEEAEQYVKESLQSSLVKASEKDIRLLIEEVGFIPQKLALAVGYMNQKRLLTLQRYVHKLQALKQAGQEQEGDLILPEARLGLETLAAPSQLLMRYGAYLDPDFIPLSLISSLLALDDEDALESLLDILAELSLITIIKGQGNELGIQIHREIQRSCRQYQAWVEESNMSEKELLLSLIEVLHTCFPDVAEFSDHNWKQAALYVSNVEEFLLLNAGKYLETSPLLASLLARMGSYNTVVRCNYKQSLQYYQEALEMLRAIYSGNHPDVTNSLNNIGLVYNSLGEHTKALQYYQEALEMRKAIYSGNHPDVANSLNNIGTVYDRLGEHTKALQYYQEALEMLKVIYSSNHPDVATSLGNIGTVYNSLGEHTKALQYHQEALEMRKAIYSGNHPSVATSLGNIGTVYNSLGEHTKALQYYQEVLTMRKAIYSGNHPDVATSLGNIGTVYDSLGKPTKALQYLKEALEMLKVIYSGNHPSVATSLNNIGTVYNSLGELRNALQYHQEALEMRKAIYPGNHPSVANSLNNIGIVYYGLGQHTKALQYHQEALTMKNFFK